MLNGYAYYLNNISSILSPLYVLLSKDTKRKWEEENAFSRAKEMLQSDALLVPNDPSKAIFLSCDASPYGFGAVLSHIIPAENDAQT